MASRIVLSDAKVAPTAAPNMAANTAAAARRPTTRRRRWRAPLASTVMACLVYAYLILPSITVIPISFSSDLSLDFSHASLALFRRLFASGTWMSSIANSASVAICASVLAVLIGTPAAYAFSRGRFHGKGVAQMIVICPLFVPVIVIALGLYFVGALAGTNGTRSMLVLAHTMYAMPFVIVLVLSGLRQIDPSLERSATVMGATPLRIFGQIILPQLRIPIVAGLLFAFLVSFDEVMIAWFLSGPKIVTLPVRMYSNIMWDNTPEIAAVSTLLTLFSFAICLVLVGLGASPLHLPARKA
jgi:putative spermidine/putrescine transport system permease protein